MRRKVSWLVITTVMSTLWKVGLRLLMTHHQRPKQLKVKVKLK
ncbi:hypothetical protein [Lactiplantibacillus pentosus]|nr:hypothetical protein [Lactiplantibacillus pentosus]